jgi:hypothetical protein
MDTDPSSRARSPRAQPFSSFQRMLTLNDYEDLVGWLARSMSSRPLERGPRALPLELHPRRPHEAPGSCPRPRVLAATGSPRSTIGDEPRSGDPSAGQAQRRRRHGLARRRLGPSMRSTDSTRVRTRTSTSRSPATTAAPRRRSPNSASAWVPSRCPNPRDLPGNSVRPLRAGGAENTPICRHIRAESALHVLLAMQKVEGSNPFSRFRESFYLQAFCARRSDAALSRCTAY